MDLINSISKLQTNVFALRNDDDLADRLNYRYTVAILVAFAVIVSHRQFSESVIKCWVPAFFTPNYEAYANQVCWISNTYYVNQTQNMPKNEETKKDSEIKYYQWIPFILLIQALFLYIPRILWRLLSARAGLDVRDLIEAAHSYKSVDKYTNKAKIMEYIVQNIDQYASNPRRSRPLDSIFQKMKYFSESLFCGSGIYLGNYLVTTYFFIKLVYLFNSIVQFFVMNEFLGKQFHELGLDIIRYMTNTYSSENSIESVYFPKVVMCDFRIREFGHPNFSHRYTIQCVLPINLYNQQIFTFLWFWFLILFFANSWALFQWINRMLPRSRRRYVNRRLNMLKYFKDLNQSTSIILKSTGLFGSGRRKAVSIEAKRQKRRFIEDYLKFDGVFILRMITMLTSEIVGTELLHELWNKRAVYKEKELYLQHAAAATATAIGGTNGGDNQQHHLYSQHHHGYYGNEDKFEQIATYKNNSAAVDDSGGGSGGYVDSYDESGTEPETGGVPFYGDNGNAIMSGKHENNADMLSFTSGSPSFGGGGAGGSHRLMSANSYESGGSGGGGGRYAAADHSLPTTADYQHSDHQAHFDNNSGMSPPSLSPLPSMIDADNDFRSPPQPPRISALKKNGIFKIRQFSLDSKKKAAAKYAQQQQQQQQPRMGSEVMMMSGLPLSQQQQQQQQPFIGSPNSPLSFSNNNNSNNMALSPTSSNMSGTGGSRPTGLMPILASSNNSAASAAVAQRNSLCSIDSFTNKRDTMTVAKPKKVVFAPNTLDNDIDQTFSGLEDVFSDLKLDTLT